MKVLSFPRLLGTRIRDAHAANPQRLRIAFFAVLAAIVVLMSVKYAAKITKPGDTGQQSRSAFLRWRHMINDVFTGENIYIGVNEYPNPPIMAILLKPFASLPPMTGALAWFYAKVLLAVIACVWAFRLVEGAGPLPAGRESELGGGSDPRDELVSANCEASSPLPAGRGAQNLPRDIARAAAILLCIPALLGDLSHNNVNIFILFLVAGCLEAFRRRLDTLAGLTLALAIACKVTPLLFVAYFAWKRCWRVLIASLAGLVLWLAIVPSLILGWDHNRELMSDWYTLMIERPLLKGEITSEHPNQAIVGLVYRLFTHSPSFLEYRDNIPTPSQYHNLVDIGRPAAWVVVKLLTALFALAVVWLCRWPVRGANDSRQGWCFAAECGLICLGMLLFSERTWKHHAVILLIPLAVLTYSIAMVDLPRWLRNFTFGVLAVSFGLMAIPGLFHGRTADMTMVYGTHTAVFVLLAVVVGLLLACRSGRVEGSRGLSVTAIPK